MASLLGAPASHLLAVVCAPVHFYLIPPHMDFKTSTRLIEVAPRPLNRARFVFLHMV